VTRPFRARVDTALAPTTVADVAPATSYRGMALARGRVPHWPLLAILAAFALSCLVVPTLAGVAISDDWSYIRSVRILIQEGRLDIHPIVSTNLVFQVGWGALFASIFGMSLGVLRLSVVVLWALSGIACYGLLWELSHRRGISALGTAVYLFNPLGYALSFTFMSDAPFTALFVISTYCSVRALRAGIDARWLLAGSAAAAAAALVRQPGVAIPVAVLLALLVTGRLRPNLSGALLVAKVAALPAVTYAVYYFWLTRIHGEPPMQALMRSQIFDGGWDGVTTHAAQIATIEATYMGLFLLPFAVGAVTAARAVVRSLTPRAWLGFAAFEAFVVAGVAGMHVFGLRMPYVPHFLSPAGLGPNDLLFGRLPLVGTTVLALITLVCAISVLVCGLLVIRALQSRLLTAPAVVLAALATQAAMTFIVSTHFRFWSIDGVPTPSLDRYLLPLMPMAVAAVVWAVRDVNFSLPLGWYGALVLGAFAVVGTRDNIAFHEATWDLARIADESGIPPMQLDAGASWSGYHIGEASYEQVGVVAAPDRRWWLGLFAGAIEPKFIISGAEHHGYTTLREYPYDLWLDTRPVSLYLLRRDDQVP
jgi:4-amino-4-deoxy-L-arabinose transferase-like glycosyltransferase